MLNRYAITVHHGHVVMLNPPTSPGEGRAHVVESPLELAAQLIVMQAIALGEGDSDAVLELVRAHVKEIEES